MREYEVTIVIRNNFLLRWARLRGFESMAALCRAAGVWENALSQYLTLKSAPVRVLASGEELWSPVIIKVARVLGTTPESLFPPQHIHHALAQSRKTFEVDRTELLTLLNVPKDLDQLVFDKKREEATESVLQELIEGGGDQAERNVDMVKRYYGFYGKEETLAEIGKRYGVTPNRVREIVAKELRKMKSKSFSNRLKPFVE